MTIEKRVRTPIKLVICKKRLPVNPANRGPLTMYGKAQGLSSLTVVSGRRGVELPF